MWRIDWEFVGEKITEENRRGRCGDGDDRSEDNEWNAREVRISRERGRRGVDHAGLLQLFTIIMADAGYETGSPFNVEWSDQLIGYSPVATTRHGTKTNSRIVPWHLFD